MNLRQFLEHSEVQLPVRRGEEDFQDFVVNRLDTYQSLLGQLTEPTDFAEKVRANTAKIKDFSEAAKQSVSAFLSGHPSVAYSFFAEGLAHIQDQVHQQALKDMGPSDLRFLYRVRKQAGASLSRKDLFHIPFHLRHLVATQRYSIPGLPCLYFGGSLFTCWAEMGRPPFHELQAAAFWLSPGTKVKILNFSDRPKRLLLYVGQDGEIPSEPRIAELLLTHVTLWPLMALS